MTLSPRFLSWLLRRFGKVAITLPPLGIYVLAEHITSERLRRHEMAHWAQYERMGLFKFYAVYLWYSLKYGYRDNPMGIEARKAETL